MNRLLLILALASLAPLASGCAALGGAPEHSGGSATLTQAAAEAAKNSDDKHKRLDVGDRVPREPSTVEVGVTLGGDEGDGSPPPPDLVTALARSRHADGPPHRWVIGAIAGGGSIGGPEYAGFGLGGLDVGVFATDRMRADLGLFGLAPNFAGLAGQGLTNQTEIAADLSVRYYLTPPHTFLGLYPIAGLRTGLLSWDYRGPVAVRADGEPKTVTDDALDYVAFYGGLGVSLVQTRHFTTGINLAAGARVYDTETMEGFQNDLFPSTGYTQLALEVMYKF